MRVLSYRDVPWLARLIIGGVAGICLVMAMVGIMSGPLVLTLASLVFMALFLCSAPFVFGRGWRKPEPMPTRRPVVRRRRT